MKQQPKLLGIGDPIPNPKQYRNLIGCLIYLT